MSNIRITEKGWETFNGEMVGVHFKDGVSTEPLSRLQIDRLSAIIKCDLLDEAGASVSQAGIAHRLSKIKNVDVDVIPASEHATEDELTAERRQNMIDSGKSPANDFYTEDQLEKIAEKGGIQAVRDVAAPWGVRGRDIRRLIDAILKAQANFLARQKELKDEQARVRAQALEESLAKQRQAERIIDDKARVLSGDTTANAIGPDGQSIYVPPAAPVLPVVPEDSIKVDDVSAITDVTTDNADPEAEQTS